jgi:indolepyruvate ferredoxin oxidoreductase alpha subunit
MPEQKKLLLMGNEAAALGAIRAGVSVVCGYPGTPATEILETVARENAGGIYVEWSVNEKAALETAAGAAMSGCRAMAVMKQVGLNVASDPLMSLNYLGVAGGLVIAVADDPGPISSQTEQDTRAFARYAGLALFDPSSPDEAYLMAAAAFAFSEKYHRPVLFRPTTRVCHGYAAVAALPALPQRDAAGFNRFDEKGKSGRWVIFPGVAYKNHIAIVDERRRQREELSRLELAPGITANTLRLPAAQPAGRKGIAAGGISRAYALEALAECERAGLAADCSLLEIGAYPFPEQLALEFLKDLDEVLVLEELDPVIEDELLRLCAIHRLPVTIRGKAAGDLPFAGEYSAALIESKIREFLFPGQTQSRAVSAAPAADGPPPRPPVLCAGCPHRASFFAVKEAVREAGRSAVFSGDIGCYTLGNVPPLDMVDTCLCMGAGFTIPQGLYRAETLRTAGEKNPAPPNAPPVLHFGFVGDSTFFHSGLSGLINAVYNNASLIAVILDNGTTAMTGGQVHPGVGRTVSGTEGNKISIPALVSALGLQAQRVNPFDLAAAKAGVKKAIDGEGVRVIIFEAPCIALARGGTPCAVSAEKCTGCGLCVKKLGCPALCVTTSGTAAVDAVQCTGCGLCRCLCHAGAIE